MGPQGREDCGRAMTDMGPLFAPRSTTRYEELSMSPDVYAWMATWRSAMERPRVGVWRNPLTGRAVVVDVATGKVRRP